MDAVEYMLHQSLSGYRLFDVVSFFQAIFNLAQLIKNTAINNMFILNCCNVSKFDTIGDHFRVHHIVVRRVQTGLYKPRIPFDPFDIDNVKLVAWIRVVTTARSLWSALFIRGVAILGHLQTTVYAHNRQHPLDP